MQSARPICSECGSPVSSPAALCLRCCLGLAAETNAAAPPATAEAGPERPGFGNYELLDRLGEGGMGIVFKARQKKLNRTVALKMLRSGSLATEAEVRRFQVEAQAAARLRHPNIVAIHEVGHHAGRPFFSMDYIHGRSLSEIVGRTPLAPRRAAGYVKILAEAVGFAHQHSVLHRDLKPANVLVDEHDQPHITDFGLAKELDSKADVTLSGAIMGTPSYMSPEQAAGKRRLISTATDIYSLGAILYDLLTGRPPFRADSPGETMRQVIESEPAPPRLLNAKVDKDLETICLKCLSKEPHQRYASAQAVADDLGRFLRQEPILARPLGRFTRGYRWVKRNPAAALSITSVSIVLLSQVMVAVWSRSDSLDSVCHASYVAGWVQLRLKEAGQGVEGFLASPGAAEIRQRLVQDPTPPLRQEQTSRTNRFVQLLQAFYESEGSPHATGSNRFENLILLNRHGDVMANYNPDPKARSLSNLASRDYFQGATQSTRPFYVSRIYRSKSDGTLKIAISAPVRLGHEVLGVLCGMIGTASTDPLNGIRLERTKTALAGEVDPSEPDGGGCAVLWHPAFKPKATNRVNIVHPDLSWLLRNDPAGIELRRVDHYWDPVASLNPWYKGRWVAGFARVPGTHLVVIDQSRDRVAMALFIDLFICSALVLLSLFWVLKKRLNRSSSVTPQP